MCYGAILSNGERCTFEFWSGECKKSPVVKCPKDADWCEECETFYDEENTCECEES